MILKSEARVGTWGWVISGPRSFSVLLHHCPLRKKEEGPILSTELIRGRLSPGPGTASADLCSVSEQIKTLLKENERI